MAQSKTVDLLPLIYPLADAVQFSLFLCYDRKNEPAFSIKGYGNMCLPVSPNNDIPFKCKVVASGISEVESYVVIEVLGDLMATVSYDKSMGQLMFMLLDANKVNWANLHGKTLKEVAACTMPAAKGRWIREERNSEWSKLDAASLDMPSMGHAQEAHRADYCLGQD